MPAGKTLRATFTDWLVISPAASTDALTPTLAVPVMRSTSREPVRTADMQWLERLFRYLFGRRSLAGSEPLISVGSVCSAMT